MQRISIPGAELRKHDKDKKRAGYLQKTNLYSTNFVLRSTDYKAV